MSCFERTMDLIIICLRRGELKVKFVFPAIKGNRNFFVAAMLVLVRRHKSVDLHAWRHHQSATSSFCFCNFLKCFANPPCSVFDRRPTQQTSGCNLWRGARGMSLPL